jgi:hypothetical protein
VLVRGVDRYGLAGLAAQDIDVVLDGTDDHHMDLARCRARRTLIEDADRRRRDAWESWLMGSRYLPANGGAAGHPVA